MATRQSPRVTHLSWGEVRVETTDGGQRSFKDVKLWPGGAREWDWDETGTQHAPGIQPADVEELLEHGADKVILSRGQRRRLQIPRDTLEWLDERGVAHEVLESRAAVERYNELASSKAVGALIHSTC